MTERFHFVGIGGAGMAPVAQLAIARGWRVSGSDQRDSRVLERLRGLGAIVSIGHDASNVPGTATLVVSSAIRESNPELRVARDRGQRVWHRSVALAAVAEGQQFVAVAGAHGKTTTSGMLAQGLHDAGEDPSFAVGSQVLALGASARLGAGRAFVAEADESDGSFLAYHPAVAIVTNVEPDHLDHYGTAEALAEAYAAFVGRITPEGLLVVCADDDGSRALVSGARCRVQSYGAGDAPAGVERHWRIEDTVPTSRGVAGVLVSGEQRQPLRVGVPGLHNLYNAAAAWIAGVELGADAETLAHTLGRFTGTGRRFEDRGEARGVRVVDDYAHHPTEIAATLAAARAVCGPGKVLVLFQPHLYSRTRDHAAGFAHALAAADVTVVTDVYGAREDPLPGVDATLVTGPMLAAGDDARYVPDRLAAAREIASAARPGDLVLTIGAGDVTDLADVILAELREGS